MNGHIKTDNVIETYSYWYMSKMGGTKSDMVRALESQLKMNISLQRFNSWLRGDVSFPRKVFEFMLKYVLNFVSEYAPEELFFALRFPVRREPAYIK